MDFQGVEDWVSDHPYATGGIVIVGGLGILWVFGAFGSSSSSATTSGGGAANYYSAEEAAAQQQAALNAAQDTNQANEAIAATDASVQNTQTGAQLQALQGYYATQQAAITANASVQEDSLASALAGLENSNAAAVSGAAINANSNEVIAGITAANNLSVANVNAQAQEDIANISATETETTQAQGIYGQLAQDLINYSQNTGSNTAPAVQLLPQANRGELISFSAPHYGPPIDPNTLAQVQSMAIGPGNGTQSGPPA